MVSQLMETPPSPSLPFPPTTTIATTAPPIGLIMLIVASELIPGIQSPHPLPFIFPGNQ